MQPTIRNWILIGIAYVAVIGAALWGLSAARSWAIETFANAEEQANWGEWQEDTKARQEAEQVPENRRGHGSEEPPTLVLLRDSFVAIVVTTVVLTTFLFAFLVFVIRGVTRSSSPSGSAR